MTLPLLLGEAPSKAGDRYHAFPLSGAVGRTLCQLSGIEPEPEGSRFGRFYWALRERFDCLNAIERYADAYPWRVERARRRWERWLAEQEDPPVVVICLGRRAADAVLLPPEWPWGEWAEVGRTRTTVLPHPSGRNLVLNDPETRALVGRVLREAAGLPVAA